MIPPVKKNWFFYREGETGIGLDSAEIPRACEGEGVVYMAKKDNRSEAVKSITRTKKYKEIEMDLRQQLIANGTCGKFYDDMIDDYMAMYVTKTLLVEDIQKRGTIVKYDNGGGQSGMKKNESVDSSTRPTRRCLNFFRSLD